MLNQTGFDLWADGYDKSVGLSDEENTYPFAGYKAVLGTIYKTIMKKPNAVVLDIGFGTGTLSAKLYENGCAIYGQDFSARMIELASEKMPNAHLYQGDFTQGLVEPLLQQRYDFIVATYSLHHMTDEQKVSFLRVLQGLLNPGGQILIGDVAFETRKQLEQCRKAAGDEWDEDEIYFVADEMRKVFPTLTFTRISYCAGILSLNQTVFLLPMTAEMYHTYYKEYQNDPDLYFDRSKCTPFVYSPEWVDRYIQRQVSRNRKCFAIMLGDEMAGEVIIKRIEPGKCATLGICMKNDSYKNRGIGTAAERLAIDYVFHGLDIPVLYADTILTNMRSQHVLEKAGFRYLRTEGDFKYYQINRGSRNNWSVE